jgi:hypothetical protein
MMDIKIRGRLWAVAVALTLALMVAVQIGNAQPTAEQVENAGLPQDALDRLRKQATAMARISLSYRQTISTGGKSGNVDFSEDFDGGRFKQRVEIHSFRGLQKRVHENAFDGRIYYDGEPEKTGGDITAMVTKYLAADTTDPLRTMKLVTFSYLDGAGFYAPSCVAEMREPLVESLVLHYWAESDSNKIERTGDTIVVTVEVPDPISTQARGIDVKQQRHELATGQNTPEQITNEIETLKKMQVMTNKRIVAFTLDAKRGYAAVKREEWTAAGQRIAVIQNDRWKHYAAADIWLPGQCTFAYYASQSLTEFSQEVMLRMTIKLSSLTFNPSQDTSFVLDYQKPGTTILDRTTPEARSNRAHMVVHKIAANGAPPRDRAPAMQHEVNPSRNGFRFCVLVIAPVILLGGGVVLMWWWKRRGRK